MGTDRQLREALLKLALGCDYEEREIVAGRSGSPERVKIIKRHKPPDLQAIAKIQNQRALGTWDE